MNSWLALMVLVSAIPSPSNAAESEGGGYDIGMQTCGQFSRAYVAHPDVTEDLYFTWAQGFMTGLNFMATVVKVPAREIKGEDLGNMRSYRSYIRTFCEEWLVLRRRFLLLAEPSVRITKDELKEALSAAVIRATAVVAMAKDGDATLRLRIRCL